MGSDSRLTQTSGGLELRELQGGRGGELEGVYHCEANNTAGAVRSMSATLTRSGAVRQIISHNTYALASENLLAMHALEKVKSATGTIYV